MPAAENQVEIATGTYVGTHRIESYLSSDDDGTDYMAWNADLGRVLLRVIASHTFATPEERREFVDRATQLQSLEHCHLVRIVDVGIDDTTSEGPVVYIATEQIDGNDFDELVRTDGAIPSELVYPIVRQVALALESLHQRGLCHGDLVPKRIILTDAGDAKLLCIPTIASNDERRDLQSLASTAYFLLTARSLPPTCADGRADVGIANEHWDSLPSTWRSILQRCLSLGDSVRLDNVSHLLLELDRSLGEIVVPETTTPPAVTIERAAVVSDAVAIEPVSASDEIIPTRLDLVPRHPEACHVSPATRPSLRSWLMRGYRQLFSSR